MKTKLKLACTLTFLALTGQVFAANPSAVTGIVAQKLDDDVVVQWDTVSSDPIAYYRVYYSEESILENDGLYDDFEVTEGNETSLSFPAPDNTAALFVAVIAVGSDGLESEFFTEEARIELDADPLPPTGVFTELDDPEPRENTPEESQPVQSSSVRLLKAHVPTPESIVIAFSSAMTVDPVRAPEGLKIEGPDGAPLQIKHITIDGKTITIATEVQERGMVYNVLFSEPFEGQSGAPLDSIDRSVLISGHDEGKEPLPQPTVRTVDPSAPPDLENITIVPEAQPNGAYTVTLQWTVDNTPGDLHGIVAYQTRDGSTFGPPDLLPIAIGGVQLQNVTPGFFGIYLQTINNFGYVSPGVFQYVSLPVYIPGQGFQGDLTFGSMNADEPVVFDETEEVVPEKIATLDAITDETETAVIEGVDHSAAFTDEMPALQWRLITLIASVTAVIIVVIIGALTMSARMKRSATA